jgi:4-hydroxyisophthalate hydroxylase
MTTGPTDTDVLIVGGGPVGLGLAVELGQRGIATTVLERNAAISPIPKGQNLTQRTMEHFRSWGAEEALRAARTVPKAHGIGGMTAYGTLLSGWHYDWLKRELVRPFYATDNERLPQYATEAVLRARVAELPTVTARYGAAARLDTAEGDRVEARLDDGTRLTARYLVGCDGARSRVREAAGITETRRDHDRLMVLLVFRSPELHGLMERFPGKSFFNVLHPAFEGYWQFFGRVDLGSTFFFHAPVPFGTTRDNFDFAALLHRAVGQPFAVEIEHIGFWDLRIAHADAYGAGRVFIAGDAAHSHPPYGGYGINTGFEDARNLGWKLAATLQGWSGPDLLASYDAERRPVFASTARDFIEAAIETDRAFLAAHDPARDRAAFEAAWAARIAGAPAEVDAYEPHYEGSPIVAPSAPGALNATSASGAPTAPGAGTPSARGRHEHAARPGHHLAPQPLSRGGTVYDALGPGFTLLALDAPEADVARFAAAAEAASVPLALLLDTAADGRERYAARLVLVRPDHFVAWAGDTAEGADAILARAIGGS